MLNITKGKLKDRTGRRVVGYFARIGDLEGQGATPAAATDALHSTLERMCNYRSPRYFPVDRYLLIICPTWDSLGSTTLLVHPDGHVSEQLRIDTDSASILQSTYMHVAQLLWGDPETESRLNAVVALLDAKHNSEFNSWVRFQLAYREARARGLSDTEAHREACHA